MQPNTYSGVLHNIYFIVITCPSLADPENGRALQTATQRKPYLTVVNISCDEGYRLEGSVSRMCLSDGTWSGVETHCVCEYNYKFLEI